MKILVHSETTDRSLVSNLGAPEYSYYFVLKAFLPVLHRLGQVEIVEHPEVNVDPIFRRCRNEGIECVFLSFSPPHRTLTNLECPTIPVFAWEFDDIPAEEWAGDKSSNWQYVLGQLAGAITHSQQSAAAVCRAVGSEYPVAVIPAPVWSRTPSHTRSLPVRNLTLDFDGMLFDSKGADWRNIGKYIYWNRDEDEVWLSVRKTAPPEHDEPSLSFWQARKGILVRNAYAYYQEVLGDLVPRKLAAYVERLVSARLRMRAETESAETEALREPRIPAEIAGLLSVGQQNLSLDGVIYSSVFNPDDGRKNARDMISAFCDAFRDNPNATLLLKLTHARPERGLSRMIAQIYRSEPFACRIVLLAGYLPDQDYQKLISATSYVVNASHGEGQCLPLMEFMSCGVPAVTPNSSAMADYVSGENAFAVNSSPEMTSWPQDPRHAYRTFRYRLDYQSLVEAYRKSYVAVSDSDKYRRMSTAARETLRRHCSDEVVMEKLDRFIGGIFSRGNGRADMHARCTVLK